MTIRKYIYDFEKVLQERDDSDVLKSEYTSTTELYGDLLSAFDGNSTNYYEPDALGSTDALINESQIVTDRWKYRAFGAATHTLGSANNPFAWAGRQNCFNDSETGLYLLGSGTRYYATDVDQFLSNDPIGFAAGDSNLRRGFANNPANRVDPTGLVTWELDKKSGELVMNVTIRFKIGGLPAVTKADYLALATPSAETARSVVAQIEKAFNAAMVEIVSEDGKCTYIPKLNLNYQDKDPDHEIQINPGTGKPYPAFALKEDDALKARFLYDFSKKNPFFLIKSKIPVVIEIQAYPAAFYFGRNFLGLRPNKGEEYGIMGIPPLDNRDFTVIGQLLLPQYFQQWVDYLNKMCPDLNFKARWTAETKFWVDIVREARDELLAEEERKRKIREAMKKKK